MSTAETGTPTQVTTQEMQDGWRAFKVQALPPYLPPEAQMLKVVEEVGELAKGIHKADRLLIVDGIGDAIYTLVGMACLYEVDLGAVWQKIQRSNMTKSRSGASLSPRGSGYVPPKLEGL